jgi:hypothetical protein
MSRGNERNEIRGKFNFRNMKKRRGRRRRGIMGIMAFFGVCRG